MITSRVGHVLSIQFRDYHVLWSDANYCYSWHLANSVFRFRIFGMCTRKRATSQRRCPVADQKDRSLWERDCTKGTPGDSWGRGYLWYWERAHSLVSAIFALILAPRATRLYFYHFIKYLVPQRTLEKQRKDIYFEIKARSKCFEITLIARAYIVT